MSLWLISRKKTRNTSNEVYICMYIVDNLLTSLQMKSISRKIVIEFDLDFFGCQLISQKIFLCLELAMKQ